MNEKPRSEKRKMSGKKHKVQTENIQRWMKTKKKKTEKGQKNIHTNQPFFKKNWGNVAKK
jgi:hypothetical protein